MFVNCVFEPKTSVSSFLLLLLFSSLHLDKHQLYNVPVVIHPVYLIQPSLLFQVVDHIGFRHKTQNPPTSLKPPQISIHICPNTDTRFKIQPPFKRLTLFARILLLWPDRFNSSQQSSLCLASVGSFSPFRPTIKINWPNMHRTIIGLKVMH